MLLEESRLEPLVIILRVALVKGGSVHTLSFSTGRWAGGRFREGG